MVAKRIFLGVLLILFLIPFANAVCYDSDGPTNFPIQPDPNPYAAGWFPGVPGTCDDGVLHHETVDFMGFLQEYYCGDTGVCNLYPAPCDATGRDPVYVGDDAHCCMIETDPWTCDYDEECCAGLSCQGGSCQASCVEGTECDTTNGCYGTADYWDGLACDASGDCVVPFNKLGCCMGSACTEDKEYCRESDHKCVTFSEKCTEAVEDGFGYDEQENGEDHWDECDESFECSVDGCTVQGADGFCNGGSEECDTNDRNTNCDSGQSCISGECTGTFCDNEDQCVGDTYYDGLTCDDSGNCNVGLTKLGCCAGSACLTTQYCSESGNKCLDLQECAKNFPNDYLYEPQENGEDINEECKVEWSGCEPDSCARTQGDGACEGGEYSCDKDDGLVDNCPAGTSCNAGTCEVASCTEDDTCVGDTFYDSLTCDGEGNCESPLTDIGCCDNQKCDSPNGEYCFEDDHDCIDLPTCAESDATGYLYHPQLNGQDLWDDCEESWTGCISSCTHFGGDGECNGTNYACDDNDNDNQPCAPGTACNETSGECDLDSCTTDWHCFGNFNCTTTCDGAGLCSIDAQCEDCNVTCCNCGIYGPDKEKEENFNCEDFEDNDCDGLEDFLDPQCKAPDGYPCTEDDNCDSGMCDNDGEGADFDPYNDDFHCFSEKPDNIGWLDNQTYMCEVSTGRGDATCDEFSNGTDCSYLDGQHYWCNGECEIENRDASQKACEASAIDTCPGAYTWLTAGETTFPFSIDNWEYAVGDKTTTECCGDDDYEVPKDRDTGCTRLGCLASDYPSFAPSPTDLACCNETFDCQYDGTCYTSDNDGGSPQTFGGDRTNTNSVVCEDGIWYDCDNSQGVCEESNGRCNINKGWMLAGEMPVGEYDALNKLECCGDDANEAIVNSSNFQGHNPTDIACCDSQFDCVFGTTCFLSDSNGGSEGECYDGIDNDCDYSTDFCDGRHLLPCVSYDGLDDSCSAAIFGKVTNLTGGPIEGAQVIALTHFDYKTFSRVINFSTYTNSSGQYNLTVYSNSSYEVIIKHRGHQLISEEAEEIEFGEWWELDVILAKDHGCQPDCTMSTDSLCHEECDTINGCEFYNRTAALACNLYPRDAIVSYNSTHTISCCLGSPFKELPDARATVEVLNASQVNTLKKAVIYRGKQVNMVIVTYKPQ